MGDGGRGEARPHHSMRTWALGLQHTTPEPGEEQVSGQKVGWSASLSGRHQTRDAQPESLPSGDETLFLMLGTT